MWGWGGGDVIHKLEMQGRTKKDLVVSKIGYRILKILNIRDGGTGVWRISHPYFFSKTTYFCQKTTFLLDFFLTLPLT